MSKHTLPQLATILFSVGVSIRTDADVAASINASEPDAGQVERAQACLEASDILEWLNKNEAKIRRAVKMP